MKRLNPITTLFLDIGGVLLTDGWDHLARHRAATTFKLDSKEMADRHHLTFETYELGKLTLDEYLDLVVFYKRRPFTRARFRSFIFAQSKACPDMLKLISELKKQYGLKIFVVSNEARELNEYRIQTFKLFEIVDSFISSSFVHMRKPDLEMFRLALDIAQAKADEVLFIDDTAMFVKIAESLEIRSIHHQSYRSTCASLASFGLQNNEGAKR